MCVLVRVCVCVCIRVCVCVCVCMRVRLLVQADLKEGYLKDVHVPLKRFSDYLKDKKWVAGDSVGLTIVTRRSYNLLSAMQINCVSSCFLLTNCACLPLTANLCGLQFV